MLLRNYFRLLAEDQPFANRWAWFWKPFLKGASLFYSIGLWAHRTLYQCQILKQRSFSLPVLSVGNLTVGGTGKTPAVAWVAEVLKRSGRTQDEVFTEIEQTLRRWVVERLG